MDTPQGTTPSRERTYKPKHFKPEFVAYLDVLVGNVLATGGSGKIEIDIVNRKIDKVWVGGSGKTGFQF